MIPALLCLATSLLAPVPTPGQVHSFRAGSKAWLLDDAPFVIRSGEIHPARVPREYWVDRLRKIRALGLNTISIYVFWNLIEPEEGEFDFTGQNDIAEFVREAGRQGLFVTLRAGPYVCAEWDWGGFPYWLRTYAGVTVRQNNAPFLKHVGDYLDALGKQLAPLTVKHGGPIILAQVENEYGSFGKDHDYMAAIRKAYAHAGFDCQFYTADGPDQGLLEGGTFNDLPCAINFGGGAEESFKELDKFRSLGPKMNGEYWCGWFDHWYEGHHTSGIEDEVKDLDWMLSRGISFNLYMVHGGTTWGWMNGANSGGKGFEPDTTSYDYDAPIAEDGSITKKYLAFRDVISRHLGPGEKIPDIPKEQEKVTIPRFELTEQSAVFDALPEPYTHEKTPSFEQMHLPYGFALYRTKVAQAFSGTLVLEGLQDRAMIYVDRQLKGILERQKGESKLNIEIPGGATLDILVENQGRVNFSHALLNERKGLAAVKLGDHTIDDWKIYPLPFNAPKTYKYKKLGDTQNEPTLYRGQFSLRRAADTYLDMQGWTKGNVWVNGHHLGRYWKIGPQQALYVPGPWLRRGRNEVIVLETEPTGHHSLEGATAPIFHN